MNIKVKRINYVYDLKISKQREFNIFGGDKQDFGIVKMGLNSFNLFLLHFIK